MQRRGQSRFCKTRVYGVGVYPRFVGCAYLWVGCGDDEHDERVFVLVRSFSLCTHFRLTDELSCSTRVRVHCQLRGASTKLYVPFALSLHFRHSACRCREVFSNINNNQADEWRMSFSYSGRIHTDRTSHIVDHQEQLAQNILTLARGVWETGSSICAAVLPLQTGALVNKIAL